MEKIVEFEDVSYNYNGIKAVENVSFIIEKGSFAGMIGPNGAGKTTIIKLLLGIITPSKGNVKLFGEDINKFKSWNKIGYVPQKANLFEQDFPANVFEIVSMGRIANIGFIGSLSNQDKKIIEKSLDIVGMLEFKNRRIRELSAGQQQKIMIARALASEPQLLILDEPTVGVDFQSQKNFYALLKKLNKELNMTIVLVSHDIGVVSKIANTLLCVNISVTMHDLSKGFDKTDLFCAYSKDLMQLPHHHHCERDSCD